jgi:hypothetical protein
MECRGRRLRYIRVSPEPFTVDAKSWTWKGTDSKRRQYTSKRLPHENSGSIWIFFAIFARFVFAPFAVKPLIYTSEIQKLQPQRKQRTFGKVADKTKMTRERPRAMRRAGLELSGGKHHADPK